MKHLSPKESLFFCLRSLIPLPLIAVLSSLIIQKNHAEAEAAFLAGGGLRPYLQDLFSDRTILGIGIGCLLILFGLVGQCVLLYKNKAEFARLNLICTVAGILLGGLLLWIFWFH